MKYLFIFFMSLSLVFLSCSKDTINTPEEEVNKNYGSLNFTIDKTTAPSDVASVKVTLSRSDKPDITGTMDLTGSNSAFINLKDVYEGNWHVKVDAYNSLNEIIYSGEADVLVKANEIVNLTITLNPVNGKLGIINITVNWGTTPTLKFIDQGAVFHGGLPLQTLGVYQPNVLNENGVYKMWYAGINGSSKCYIFYATSTDGLNWTSSTSPVLYPGFGTWDGFSVGHPKVIKINSTYYMYYRGEADTYGNWHIGLATSVDGINWTKKPTPLIKGTYGDNYQLIVDEVLFINNKFYLYFSASDDYRVGNTSKIYLATSLDGLNFDTPKIVLAASQPWESKGLYQASVIWDEQKFKMIYNDFPECKRIGYAESFDGINWVKNTESFYSVNEAKNGWVWNLPSINFVKINGEYKVYYAGMIPTAYFYKIGLLNVVR